VFAYHVVVKARAFIDAQQAANPARDTANHAADRATHWAAYGAAFGCATFRTGGNALRLHREWRGEQSRNHGYSEFFLHHSFSVSSSTARLNIGLPQKFRGRGEAEIRVAGRGRLPRAAPVALAKFRGQ
jgi:hypothetical protein